MSYEYKYQSRLEDIVDDNVTEVDEQIFILDEIGYVYAQAAKADEYEAKAKAFDCIVEQRKDTGVITLGHYAWHIIREYESGGSND